MDMNIYGERLKRKSEETGCTMEVGTDFNGRAYLIYNPRGWRERKVRFYKSYQRACDVALWLFCHGRGTIAFRGP